MGPDAITGVLIKKGKFGYRDTKTHRENATKTNRENEGRYRCKPRNTKDCWQPPEPRREA